MGRKLTCNAFVFRTSGGVPPQEHTREVRTWTMWKQNSNIQKLKAVLLYLSRVRGSEWSVWYILLGSDSRTKEERDNNCDITLVRRNIWFNAISRVPSVWSLITILVVFVKKWQVQRNILIAISHRHGHGSFIAQVFEEFPVETFPHVLASPYLCLAQSESWIRIEMLHRLSWRIWMHANIIPTTHQIFMFAENQWAHPTQANTSKGLFNIYIVI